MRSMEEQKELIRYAIITGIKYVGLAILAFYLIIMLFFGLMTQMIPNSSIRF
jgi:hypothetical protein